MKAVSLSLAALSLGLSSCGGDSGNSSEAFSRLLGLSLDQRTSMDGSYESGCSRVVSGGARFYVKISLQFLNPSTRDIDRYVVNGGDRVDTLPYGIYVQNSFFKDPDCAVEVVRGENKGEFTVSSDGKKLTVDSRDMNIAPMEYDTAIQFNQESMCGFSEWKVGMERNTIGTTCASSSTENVFFLSRLDDSPRLLAFDAYICDGNVMREGCSRVSFRRQIH